MVQFDDKLNDHRGRTRALLQHAAQHIGDSYLYTSHRIVHDLRHLPRVIPQASEGRTEKYASQDHVTDMTMHGKAIPVTVMQNPMR